MYQARYRMPINKATAGNLVLVEGIDAPISKTATVVAEFYDQPVREPLALVLGAGSGCCWLQAGSGAPPLQRQLVLVLCLSC